MFNIIENKKPNLDVIKMNCDIKLDEKLDQIPLYRNINGFTSVLFLGKPSSGKTSLMTSIMYKKPPNGICNVHDNIFLFMPSNSRRSLKKNRFDEEIKPENLFDELNYDNLNEVFERIKNADSDEKHLIILDDQTAHLKDGDVMKLLNEINYNRRHLHVSIWFLCQNYISIPKPIRMILKNLFIFKSSIEEMNTIKKELIEGFKYDMGDLMKFVYDKPHNFLFVNTDTQTFFKNWDQIIL